MIAMIAAHQMLSLRRQRIFLAVLATLMAMTTLAGLIGWSSHQTIVRVYDEAVRMLGAQGKPAPLNPFVLKPTLSLLSNMAIYIPLIGALLALILGHLSLADDESNGVGRLIFSRQVSRRSYFFGKLAAAAVVLAVILVVSFVISSVSLVLVNGAAPSATDFLRLAVFYAVSWLYLMMFALIGMVTVLLTRRRSLALLAALGVWLVLTFAMPQFTSGLRPTASLNPITDPVSTSQTFFKVTAKARPFSVSEQYKEVSARVLETGASESTSATALRVVPIAVLLGVLMLMTARLVRRHDYSRSSADE